MSSIPHQRPLKITPNMAAADICGAAVALTELSAAFVSFQWQQPSHPPAQNVNSAASPVFPATHFSGKYAKSAQNAANFAFCAVHIS